MSNRLIFFLDIDFRDQNGEKWTHYWKTADLYSRIDYVMVSRGAMPEILDAQCRIHRPANWNDSSDHCPLVLMLNPVEKKD